MAKWINTLDLSDLWNRYDEGTITPQEIGAEIATRLQTLPLPLQFRDEVDDIVEELEDVQDIDSFNDIMHALWDLGDTSLPTPVGEMQRKLIWIRTF